VADAIENRHAVNAGHDEIKQNEGDLLAILGFENLESLLTRTARLCLEAETLDRFFENTPLGWIVIDDQDTLGHGARNFTFTDTKAIREAVPLD
jgi:hypothetical protein